MKCQILAATGRKPPNSADDIRSRLDAAVVSKSAIRQLPARFCRPPGCDCGETVVSSLLGPASTEQDGRAPAASTLRRTREERTSASMSPVASVSQEVDREGHC